ncbi:diaminopimelate epimerase [Sulfoacidibacillus thermotolerans]|uniref:Diaminopimelate epimerase n=1 Tax=Sulfoacidibacillus thermotolerans TaxID=1765684 RepID=A0A2U3DAS9_SULT2|nr:diaminopimelate epimerase [Sulfoacidibacillus thermotolerans]PWI58381.1 diaminopimelate epimerase [Sulfoacidibacillus thermotolerans]
MKFAKMHGLGNNYIYVNLWDTLIEEKEFAPLAVAVSNVNTGIGSDGMITMGPSHIADARMRIFNEDGSEGENCGNGLRCVGKYLYEKGIVPKERLTVETKGGLMYLELHLNEAGDVVEEVTVDMGEPRLRREQLPVLGGAPDEQALLQPIEVGGEMFQFTGVSMGNPHAVIFVDDATKIDVAGIGPKLEHHPLFPERVNVEFVTAKNDRELDFRVWERGSGITMACGTGACAAVVAGVLTNRLQRGETVVVHLLGGDLSIRWGHDGHVYMRGPAAWICEGEWLGDGGSKRG